MAKLEIDEENKFVDEAYKVGCKAIKFIDPARRGAPDRMVLCPPARTIFFEFKRRDNKKKEINQRTYRKGLEGMMFEVHKVYTCEEAMAILLDFLHAD